jgi:hypothetical protein
MSSNGHSNKASPRYPVPTIVSRRPRRALGLKDPSYVADTPHDLWWAMQRNERMRSTRSAEELEAYIREAPELEALLTLALLDRGRYDGLGQLLAKVVLEHYERHPQDVRLPTAVQRELGKSHPQLVAQVSTPQWLWAIGAANRVWDAHQEGN